MRLIDEVIVLSLYWADSLHNLFDLCQLTNFADDNYCLEWNINLQLLVINLEKKLETITKWLRGSGLVVNQDKTEICVFHSNEPPVVIINVDGVPVKIL